MTVVTSKVRFVFAFPPRLTYDQATLNQPGIKDKALYLAGRTQADWYTKLLAQGWIVSNEVDNQLGIETDSIFSIAPRLFNATSYFQY